MAYNEAAAAAAAAACSLPVVVNVYLLCTPDCEPLAVGRSKVDFLMGQFAVGCCL